MTISRIEMQRQRRGTFSGLGLRAVALLTQVWVAVLPVAALAFDAHRVEPSVYKIYTFIPEQNEQYSVSSGSGFLASGQRYVVTNFHVVEGGARFYIAYRNGDEAKLVEARRVDSRPNVDLALLEAREDLPGTALELGEYEPDKLASVIAIGFPGAANLNKELVPGADVQGVPVTDLESSVTTGVVSRMTFTSLKVSDTQTLSARTVQHNAAINPGNSGGPLFDACGLVVGVNTLQGLNSQGLFFSVHAAEIGKFLRESQIAFASTTTPCAIGATSSSSAPVMVGLTVLLAAAAGIFLLRSPNAPAWLQRVIPASLAAFVHRSSSADNASKIGRSASTQASKHHTALELRPVDGSATVQLDEHGRPATIGRGPGADIVVASDTVSKVHARLVFDRERQHIRVTDLNSSNGTYLNGIRIEEGEAEAGARLRLGAFEMTVAPTTMSANNKSAAAELPGGWMLSGFDPSGRAVQFELRPENDPETGLGIPVTWSFGRVPSRANFVIDDDSVSSLHALIIYNPGEGLVLRDMGSRNGTQLDGKRIGEAPVSLREAGHEIAFGLATLRLSRLLG